MEFRVLNYQDCEQVRLWRNNSLVALRTPFPLAEEQQETFYRTVVCDRNARARYWGIWVDDKFIGMCGIENIEWENARAEISLIIDPEKQQKGYGEQALELLLTEGFFRVHLVYIWGECYYCNPAKMFWEKMITKYDAETVIIPATKYWEGAQYPSLHFTFESEKCGRLLY